MGKGAGRRGGGGIQGRECLAARSHVTQICKLSCCKRPSFVTVIGTGFVPALQLVRSFLATTLFSLKVSTQNRGLADCHAVSQAVLESVVLVCGHGGRQGGREARAVNKLYSHAHLKVVADLHAHSGALTAAAS